MANLFEQFKDLGKGQFIAIKGYRNQNGEISNYVINGKISVTRQKEIDYEILKNCTEAKLQEISVGCKVPFDICKVALSEMTISAEKNLSENIEDRTKNSQAQTNAFVDIGNGIRVNRAELTVQIFGMIVQKTVIVKGDYKTVNSRPKTIAKNAIKKYLGLKSDKFRSFLIESIDSIKINGNEIELS